MIAQAMLSYRYAILHHKFTANQSPLIGTYGKPCIDYLYKEFKSC